MSKLQNFPHFIYNRKFLITLFVIVLILIISLYHWLSLQSDDGQGRELEKDKELITVGSGPLSGIYYPMGLEIAEVIEEHIDSNVSILATGASAENIDLITSGEIDTAIVMADAALQAYKGFGVYEEKDPLDGFKAITSLYPNYVQIVTTEQANIETFHDIKGKRVGVGAPGSGVELNARMILEAHDMDYSDIQEEYLDYGEAIVSIKNEDIDVAFVTSGIPNPTVEDLSSSHQVKLVPIEGEYMEKLQDELPFFVENEISQGVYGIDDTTTTATITNILIVREDLDDETAYRLTQAVSENLDMILSEQGLTEQEIAEDSMANDTVIPLHPGAEQYYQEVGLVDEK